MIYFIQEGNDGPIKIGISKNPKKRHGQLKTANPRALNLLHYENGGKIRERTIHRSFDHARLRGEWFSPVPELLRFINYLSMRGRGQDRIGEIVERGDYVSFHSDRLVSFGTVVTAANSKNGSVTVISSDGKIQNVRCNELLVHSKNPQD